MSFKHKICTVNTVEELCEMSSTCHSWWHMAVYAYGCNVCHCFSSPLGDCLLQTLNSFLGEKQNPKTPPASLFTPLCVFCFSSRALSLCPSLTYTCIKHMWFVAVYRELMHAHICDHYSKENGRKMGNWRHTSDLTALPVTSHDSDPLT